MLAHHANAKAIRGVRVRDVHFAAAHANRAAVRLIETKQHAHECGLAGTVLSQ